LAAGQVFVELGVGERVHLQLGHGDADERLARMKKGRLMLNLLDRQLNRKRLAAVDRLHHNRTGSDLKRIAIAVSPPCSKFFTKITTCWP
jgi:hypothetical protein